MRYLNNFSNKRTNYILFFLIIIDFVFILMHLVLTLITNSIPFLKVDSDGGLPEIFQYIKFTAVLFVVIYLIFKKGKKYFCWFVFFLLLLLDDAFKFHEISGRFLATLFNMQPFMGLRSVDYGELLYAFAAGFTILPLMAYCYTKGDGRYQKSFFDICLLIGVLLFFGIFVDMVHSYFDASSPWGGILGLLEDGGEMIALSLITWYFFFISIGTKNKQVFLHTPLLDIKKRIITPYEDNSSSDGFF